MFCSALCNNRYHNPEKNKALMTPDVREKLSLIRRKDQVKAYPKRLGEHEHRRVAELLLHRILLPGEVVHHKDGNKQNNSLENLYVFPNQAEHARWHMLERYGEAPELIGGEPNKVPAETTPTDSL